MKSLLTTFITAVLFTACVSPVRLGRDAFHGGHVLVRDSQKVGRIVLELGTEFDPFQGNGRTCGTCHKAQDKFGMNKRTRDALKKTDLFFYDQLDEDQKLLRRHGLVHVVGKGLDEFRQIPSLNLLCRFCDQNGNCDSLGLNGDRVSSLHTFTVNAIINHSAKTPVRKPGVDFLIPDAEIIDNIVKYMLSDEVCSNGR